MTTDVCWHHSGCLEICRWLLNSVRTADHDTVVTGSHLTSG